jgi:hypothetical protein
MVAAGDFSFKSFVAVYAVDYETLSHVKGV